MAPRNQRHSSSATAPRPGDARASEVFTHMRLARAGPMAALAVLIAACDTARKVEEASAVNDCARCHGFPPPDPHPQSTACDLCHSTTVGPGDVIIAGGTHMDGRVEVSAHAVPFPPSVHGPEA